MQFLFSALLLVFFEVLTFRIVLTCCTPKPTFLHKKCSGVALGSLANFNCQKHLYFCRKCLTTNSCLIFTFLYCSLEAQKIFYSSIAKVLHFLCRCSALPLPNSCSSIATFLLANWLLFHWHISVHPTPNGYFVTSFATYLCPLCSSIANWLLFHCHISALPLLTGYFLPFPSLLFHCQLVALPLTNVCSSIANWLLFTFPLYALPLPNGCSSIATFLLFHCQLATFYLSPLCSFIAY